MYISNFFEDKIRMIWNDQMETTELSIKQE